MELLYSVKFPITRVLNYFKTNNYRYNINIGYSMKELIDQIIKFRDERDWKQFHTPANLAKSISLESAEILEHFQWNDEFDKEELSEEIADVFIYVALMADSIDVDLTEIVKKKLALNNEKYPVSKSKSSSKKYTEFDKE